MNTRTARPSDARAIAALHVRAWQVAYAGTFPDGYLANMDVETRVLRRRRHIEEIEPPAAIFVIEDDDGIGGFTHVGPYRLDEGEPPLPAGEIYAIYVHPARFSTGAGLELMRTAVAHLTDVGFADIRIWVLDDNPRARRFYERRGFLADGAAKTYTLDPGGPYETKAREVRYRLPVP